MAALPTLFSKTDIKVPIGIRKVSIQKRPLKKSPGKFSIMFYLPIHKDEAQRLGLNEGSLVKAEIAVLPSVDIEKGIMQIAGPVQH